MQLLEGSEVHTHAVRLQEELLEDFEELQKKLRWLALKNWIWMHTSLMLLYLMLFVGIQPSNFGRNDFEAIPGAKKKLTSRHFNGHGASIPPE